MQLEELKNNLDNQVRNQRLRLNEETLPGTAIYRELQVAFKNDLAVINPDISLAEDKVRISGIFQNDVEPIYPLQIYLWEANHDIHGKLVLKSDKPIATEFLATFVKLNPYPGEFGITDISAIVVCSMSDPYSDEQFYYKKGLNFLSQFTLPTNIQSLSPLFEGASPLDISCRISATDTGYSVKGLSRPFVSLPMGSLSAGVSIGFDWSINENKKKESSNDALQLRIETQFHDQNLCLVSEPFLEDTGSLLFNAEFDKSGLQLPSINALFDTFDIHYPELIPQKYLPNDSIHISRFQFLLSLAEGSIDSIDVGLSTAMEFSLMPGSLSLKLVGLDLMVSHISESPHVSASIQAEINIGDVRLEATTMFPSVSVDVSLHPDQPLLISKLLDPFLPQLELPDVSIDNIVGQVDIESGSFMLELAVAAGGQLPFLRHLPPVQTQWHIYLAHNAQSTQAAALCSLSLGSTEIELGAKLGNEVELSGEFQNLSLRTAVTQLIQKEIAEIPEINIQSGYMMLNSNGDFSLSGEMDFDFSSLLTAFDMGMPDTVNVFSLEYFTLTGNLADLSFNLRFGTDSETPLLHNASQSLSISSANLSISSADGLRVSFSLKGKTQIADQVYLDFNQMALDFESRTRSWASKNKAVLSLYDKDYQLEISLGNDQLKLRYPEEIIFSDFGGNGKVCVNDLLVFAESVGSNETSRTRWGLGGDVSIQAAGLGQKDWLHVDGKLQLETDQEKPYLTISAAAPELPQIPLPTGLESDPKLNISLEEFGLTYASITTAPGETAGKPIWLVTAKATLNIIDVPDLLKKYLPPPEEILKGKLEADGSALRLWFTWPERLQPSFPSLALKISEGAELKLGQPKVHIDWMSIELSKQTKLIQSLTIGNINNINYLFGKNAKGRPKKNIVAEEFTAQLQLGEAFKIAPVTSPLIPLEFKSHPQYEGRWTEWDFGQHLGRFEFRVPEFELDKGRWRFSGGFDRVSETSIPFGPIKYVLARCGVPQDLLNLLPDALPLRDVDLTGDNFFDHIQLLLGAAVDNAHVQKTLQPIIDGIQSAVELLPERFREYMQLRVPKSMTLDVSVDSLQGGTSIGLRVAENEQPLRILLPLMSLTGPELIGFTLHGFSFGQQSGGSVIRIEYDGVIDRFNLIELATALVIAQKDKKPIPLSNRMILNKTQFLLPTAFPIAFPLFYEELGFEYRDILGFQLASHWSNPDPDWGIMEYIGLFSALVGFLTDKELRLQDQGLGESLNTRFIIGRQLIALPQFLGGAKLAPDTHSVSLNSADAIAKLLDAFKFGNPGYAVQIVPLKVGDTWIRIGAINGVKLGPLELDGVWCITTEEEFINRVVPGVKGDPAYEKIFNNNVLLALPKTNGKPVVDGGFIIFLAGGIDLGKIVGLQAQFGLAVTAAGGFATGFAVNGLIANGLLGLTLVGRIQATQSKFEMLGEIALEFNKNPFLKTTGGIVKTQDSFSIPILIELSTAFSMGGTLIIDKQGMTLEGVVQWAHIRGEKSGYRGSLAITDEGVAIGFGWTLLDLTGKVTVQIPGSKRTLFKASVVLHPDPAFQQAFQKNIVETARQVAEAGVDAAYDSWQQALAETKALNLNVDNVAKWLRKFAGDTKKAIMSAISKKAPWGTKGTAKKKARKHSHYKRLNRLGQARTRAQIKAAINDFIRNNALEVKVIGISFYKRSPLFSKRQIADMKQAVKAIDRLPQSKAVIVKTKAIYDKIPPKDKLMSEINNEIKTGATSAIPSIKSISFTSSLGIIDPGKISANVICLYKDKERSPVALELNLKDPVGTARKVAELFA
jgi:hypothetical protein